MVVRIIHLVTEAFSAHKCILGAQSPVFKVELIGAMKESTITGVCIRTGDMLPQVFNALLHFSYKNFLAAGVLCSGLLFNIQRANEISNAELLSLMFQKSSKVSPSFWQLRSDATCHKLI